MTSMSPPLSSLSPSSTSSSTIKEKDIKFVLHENGTEPFTTEAFFINRNHVHDIETQYDWSATMQCNISSPYIVKNQHMYSDKVNLHLCYDGFYEHDDDHKNNNNNFQDKISTVNYYVPLLKSNLQKAIRRGNKQAAIHTTAQLWFQDLKALVRRLPIICIEDALLHPHFPFLVWIMCAEAKGFILSRSFMYMSLGIVADLCDCPYREENSTVKEMSIKDIPELMDVLRNNSTESPLIPDGITCVLSLLIRMSLGGMKGDMHLLHCLAYLWIQRFKAATQGTSVILSQQDNNVLEQQEQQYSYKQKQQEQNENLKISARQFQIWNEDNFDVDKTTHSVRSLLESQSHQFISSTTATTTNSSSLSKQDSSSVPVSFLREEDKLPSAADFHCTSIIHDMRGDPGVADMLAHHSDDILKSAMWHKRSKINFRQVVPGSAVSSEVELSNADQIEQAWCFMSEVIDSLSMSYWQPQEVRSPKKSFYGKKRRRKSGSNSKEEPVAKKTRLITDFFKKSAN